MNISVVISLYNKSYSLERCLNSIFSQTILPTEVIVINDGSTDNSLDVLNDFMSRNQHRGLNLITRNQVNQGVSAARNNGIAMANSEYIALLDADDEWTSIFIDNIIKLITLYPAQPLYTCKHIVRDEHVGEFYPFQSFGGNEEYGLIDNYHALAARYPVVNSSKIVVRKESIQSIGGFPLDGKLCEDLYVWSRLSHYGKFGFFDRVGAIINQTQDLSRNSRANTLPYIISYYADKMPCVDVCVIDYLWVVYKNHLRLSILNANRSELLSRWRQGKSIFGKKSWFLLYYLLIPSTFLRSARKIRRFYLKYISMH
jgi:glycosyltransferase involved in cell wall biosynthesis